MAREETDLVTVASSHHGYEMHIRKAHMEEHGIRAFLRDEHMTTTSSYASALGGVRLDVMRRDEVRARALLTEFEAEMEASEQRGELSLQPWQELHRLETVDEADEVSVEVRHVNASEEACPACGAHTCMPAQLSLMQLLYVIVLCGVPLLWMKSSWRCTTCGHHWQS